MASEGGGIAMGPTVEDLLEGGARSPQQFERPAGVSFAIEKQEGELDVSDVPTFHEADKTRAQAEAMRMLQEMKGEAAREMVKSMGVERVMGTSWASETVLEYAPSFTLGAKQQLIATILDIAGDKDIEAVIQQLGSELEQLQNSVGSEIVISEESMLWRLMMATAKAQGSIVETERFSSQLTPSFFETMRTQNVAGKIVVTAALGAFAAATLVNVAAGLADIAILQRASEALLTGAQIPIVGEMSADLVKNVALASGIGIAFGAWARKQLSKSSWEYIAGKTDFTGLAKAAVGATFDPARRPELRAQVRKNSFAALGVLVFAGALGYGGAAWMDNAVSAVAKTSVAKSLETQAADAGKKINAKIEAVMQQVGGVEKMLLGPIQNAVTTALNGKGGGHWSDTYTAVEALIGANLDASLGTSAGWNETQLRAFGAQRATKKLSADQAKITPDTIIAGAKALREKLDAVGAKYNLAPGERLPHLARKLIADAQAHVQPQEANASLALYVALAKEGGKADLAEEATGALPEIVHIVKELGEPGLPAAWLFLSQFGSHKNAEEFEKNWKQFKTILLGTSGDVALNEKGEPSATARAIAAFAKEAFDWNKLKKQGPKVKEGYRVVMKQLDAVRAVVPELRKYIADAKMVPGVGGVFDNIRLEDVVIEFGEQDLKSLDIDWGVLAILQNQTMRERLFNEIPPELTPYLAQGITQYLPLSFDIQKDAQGHILNNAEISGKIKLTLGALMALLLFGTGFPVIWSKQLKERGRRMTESQRIRVIARREEMLSRALVGVVHGRERSMKLQEVLAAQNIRPIEKSAALDEMAFGNAIREYVLNHITDEQNRPLSHTERGREALATGSLEELTSEEVKKYASFLNLVIAALRDRVVTFDRLKNRFAGDAVPTRNEIFEHFLGGGAGTLSDPALLRRVANAMQFRPGTPGAMRVILGQVGKEYAAYVRNVQKRRADELLTHITRSDAIRESLWEKMRGFTVEVQENTALAIAPEMLLYAEDLSRLEAESTYMRTVFAGIKPADIATPEKPAAWYEDVARTLSTSASLLRKKVLGDVAPVSKKQLRTYHATVLSGAYSDTWRGVPVAELQENLARSAQEVGKVLTRIAPSVLAEKAVIAQKFGLDNEDVHVHYQYDSTSGGMAFVFTDANKKTIVASRPAFPSKYMRSEADFKRVFDVWVRDSIAGTSPALVA